MERGDEHESQEWFNPGVRSVGLASFLYGAGHEIPTSLLPSFLTVTLGAPASALRLIEGIADGTAGVARREAGRGALADDPVRRPRLAVGGYVTTAVLSSAIGVGVRGRLPHGGVLVARRVDAGLRGHARRRCSHAATGPRVACGT